jgi:hypothetical protein
MTVVLIEDARSKDIVGLVGVRILSMSHEGAEVLFDYTPGSGSMEGWPICPLCSICTGVNIMFSLDLRLLVSDFLGQQHPVISCQTKGCR